MTLEQCILFIESRRDHFTRLSAVFDYNIKQGSVEKTPQIDLLLAQHENLIQSYEAVLEQLQFLKERE